MKRPDPETHPSPQRAVGYLFTRVLSVTHCGNGNINGAAWVQVFKKDYTSLICYVQYVKHAFTTCYVTV